jgi:uncharacterized protein with GYD domain
MAVYMTQFSYTPEAWAALIKNPADRTVGLKNLVEKMGGELLDFYYSFGDQDGVAIMEIPDASTAAACVLAVTASGHLRGTKTTQLLTVEEAVKAMSSAGEQVYAAPEG